MTNSKLKLKLNSIFIILFLGFFLFIAPTRIYAADVNVAGKAKVANTNVYLDFNSTPYNSNIKIDNTNGNFSGYVWSEDLGWVAFGTTDNPSGPVNLNLSTGVVSGKAYVLDTGAYLYFSGDIPGSVPLGNTSNVTVNIVTKAFSGNVWSEDLGWINFSDTGVATATSLDTTAPSIRITDLGAIANVPDAVNLTYYFTSNQPVIKGTSEANATITFKTDSHTYTTTAGSDGKFTITINNPALVDGTNILTYYASDQSSNKSADRTLTLILGVDNFPDWVKEKLGLTSPTIGTETPSPTGGVDAPQITPTLAPTKQTGVAETEAPTTQRILIQDDKGNILKNTAVIVDGKLYTSDVQGYITVPSLKITSTAVLKDTQAKGVVKGSSIIFSLGETTQTSILPILCLIFLLILVLIVGAYLLSKKSKKKSA